MTSLVVAVTLHRQNIAVVVAASAVTVELVMKSD